MKLFKLFMTLAIFSALLYLSHGYILTEIVQYLYYKDELRPADAIVVLAGEEKERVEYGVKLFKEGWARKDRIILSGGPLIWKYSWASLMREQAISIGVPSKAILLEDKSTNTAERARFTKDILQKHGYVSCILVTSPYQSKRTFKTFKKIMGDTIIISAPSEESWFRFDEWWKRERDREAVLAEFSKFFWFWVYGRKVQE